MFQFMRPIQDPNLRIMIPEELEKGGGCGSAGGSHQNGGGSAGHWASFYSKFYSEAKISN
jgi:hypothetical protein